MQNIDCIYYINLTHRKDRNKEFIECMSDLDVPSNKLQRINAIYNPSFGALGCVNSHILALETFISSGLNICIVFEDDFIYKNKESFWSDISKAFDTNLPFDIIQLSYNDIYRPDKYFIVNNTEYPFLKKVEKTLCASSYIITKEFAPKLLENFKESSELLSTYGFNDNAPNALDVHWHTIQSKYNWYIIYPSIGFQRASYSDICKTHTSYGV